MPRDQSAWRNDLLADVEVLRGLPRAAAEAAAIHQQGFAVGSDQQQGVALAHVDGLHQQRVARVLDGARRHGSQRGQQQRGPGKAALPAPAAAKRPDAPARWPRQAARRRQRTARAAARECGNLPRPASRKDAPGQRRCAAPAPPTWPEPRRPAGQTASASSVTSAAGISTSKQRQDEDIHRQRKDGDAVEVDGHGQGHGQLHDAGDDHQLDRSGAGSAPSRERCARRCERLCPAALQRERRPSAA